MTNSSLKIALTKSTESQHHVNVVIGIKHTHSIIDFLLQNQISFYMSAFDDIASSTTNQAVQNQQIIANQNSNTPDSNNNIFERVFQKYIINNLEGSPPKVVEIAKEFGMTSQTLKNMFLEHYGKTFYQIYLERKMEYGAELLKQGHTASYISNRIGYSHPIKFNKMFQKHFGITPKKYQMQHR